MQVLYVVKESSVQYFKKLLVVIKLKWLVRCSWL